jgi:predicted lipoprotein with Yx(FWY)xxD motif
VSTMRRMRTAVIGVAILALAGCSGGGDDDAGDTAGGGDTTTEESAAPEETPEETPTDDAAGAGGDVAVELASTSLGEVLVDGEGMTLYMFDPDADAPGESTCYDQCATAWPPLVGEGEPTLGEGLDEAMVGSIERTDGTMQVTYNDWPLYYWQNDEAPGDVTGQAVNDVWWVLGADGEPIRTAPEATPTS